MVSEQFCICVGLKFVSWKEIIFDVKKKRVERKLQAGQLKSSLETKMDL